VNIQLAGFRLRRLIATGVAVLCLAGLAFADTIKLKNGSVIKGKVVSFGQGEFTVILDLGTSTRRSTSRMIIAVEDIESIEFDGSEQSAIGARPEPARDNTIRDAADPGRAVPPPPETTVPPPTTPEPEAGPPAESPGSSSGLPVIAEKEVRVAAAADWTSTEIRVQKGQRITISASGEIDLGGSQRSGPGGITRSDSRKLIASRPTGALIAVIGDDNDDFVFVGKQTDFQATHNGILFLSVNEGDLKDNSGSFIAHVKVAGSK